MSTKAIVQCQVYCSSEVPAACHCPTAPREVPTLDGLALALTIGLIAIVASILIKGRK